MQRGVKVSAESVKLTNWNLIDENNGVEYELENPTRNTELAEVTYEMWPTWTFAKIS